jgi:hypothetical protein
MADPRPYIYAHEQDSQWSLVLYNPSDQSHTTVKECISREQAIEELKRIRKDEQSNLYRS